MPANNTTPEQYWENAVTLPDAETRLCEWCGEEYAPYSESEAAGVNVCQNCNNTPGEGEI